MKGLSVIILAAGAARRMKQAKMLLPFEHSTILQTILARAKDIEPDTICVVTGFYHKEILQIIHDEQVHFIFNEQWEEGLSGSIKNCLI